MSSAVTGNAVRAACGTLRAPGAAFWKAHGGAIDCEDARGLFNPIPMTERLKTKST